MLQTFADMVATATLGRDAPAPRPRAGMEAADAAWLADRRALPRTLRREAEAAIPAAPRDRPSPPRPAAPRAAPKPIRLDLGA